MKHKIWAAAAAILVIAIAVILKPRWEIDYEYALDQQDIGDGITTIVNATAQSYSEEGMIYVYGNRAPFALSLSVKDYDQQAFVTLKVNRYVIYSESDSIDILPYLDARTDEFQERYDYSGGKHGSAFSAHVRSKPMDIEWQDYRYEIEFQICDDRSNCTPKRLEGVLRSTYSKHFGFLLWDKILSV